MRAEVLLLFFALAFVAACSLLAKPSEYGTEWTEEGARDVSDASSEDGG